MNTEGDPKRFVLAGAIHGRLRLAGLSAEEPWDAIRLIYRTEAELTARTCWDRRWIVRTVHELDHALSLSHGIPVPIALTISDALLARAEQTREGSGG
ncbi:MAG TPA: hypothetical protein VEP50_19225 [bacterium]|nr:hypothetical protein [bacterium]